ncbi:MAG: GMC family oxidoreductase [Chloroflexota bacterium]|nr:GMC family oxidoreductase [Chloroflexota bacterium]MDE3101313.1 GMC family oxidoreductase [Chloroflexota bacterium]
MADVLTPRQTATLEAVVDTFVPDADASAVARTIVREVAAVGRPKLLSDLRLFLGVIEHPVASVALAGRAVPFSRMDRTRRERYLISWADSAVPLRRTAFQAVKRASCFFAYGAAEAGADRLWGRIGYERGELLSLPDDPTELPSRPTRDGETVEADACVVGSGPGGSVVAAELTRAGRRVVVLEQGCSWTESDLDGAEAASFARLMWDRGLGTTDDLGVAILAGGVVGGGSVVAWSTSLRLPAAIREEWTRLGLDGLDGEIDAHYDTVERRLDVDTDESEINPQNSVLARGCEALGLPWQVIPRNTKGCADCGHCGLGCRHGAKRSTPRTFLRDAIGGGADLVADCRADRVVCENGRVVGVAATVRDRGGERRIVVRAPLVVAAGGSIGTPALLLRSGVGGREVGRSLHIHPVPGVAGVYDEPIRSWSGVPQSVMSDAFAEIDGAYGFRLEVPSTLPGLLAAALPWRSAAEHSALMSRLDHVAAIIPLVNDRESGSVAVDRYGAPVVRYALRGLAAKLVQRAIVETARIHLAAGAREVHALFTRPVRVAPGEDFAAFERQVVSRGTAPNRIALFTAHQMSTCRMGADAATSVADPDGAVRGVRGLYVADASAFPTASGVNPTLTIMALAMRNARRILAAR